MKLIKLSILLLAVGLFFTSCGDDEGAPEIAITTPADGSTFTGGDVVNFVVTLTDDVGVVSVNVENTDLNLNQSIPIDNPQPTINLNYDLSLDENIPAGEYEIVFTANDADANSDEEKIKINIE